MDIILNTTFDNPKLPVVLRPGFIDSFDRGADTLMQTDDRKDWEQRGSAWATTGDGAAMGSAEVFANALSADGTLTVKLRKVDADGDRRGGVAFRVVDRNNYIRICPNTSGKLTLYVYEDNSVAESASTESTLADGDILAVSGNGASIVVQVNGSTVLVYETERHRTATKHGLYSWSTNNTEFEYVSFKL